MVWPSRGIEYREIDGASPNTIEFNKGGYVKKWISKAAVFMFAAAAMVAFAEPPPLARCYMNCAAKYGKTGVEYPACIADCDDMYGEYPL